LAAPPYLRYLKKLYELKIEIKINDPSKNEERKLIFINSLLSIILVGEPVGGLRAPMRAWGNSTHQAGPRRREAQGESPGSGTETRPPSTGWP